MTRGLSGEIVAARAVVFLACGLRPASIPAMLAHEPGPGHGGLTLSPPGDTMNRADVS